ncbi:MAG: 2-dehydro-3-deoxyphosphogluconate aldolase / (4S)-4-hydroxy-2-oxoglutarate aldolase [Tepidanaerobacteraceae bacterium]|nr:2-dehydro-3-deoxyphosphogluconate aldolase / (4S)-4-hydroxy-2-oxoglutarate aldolase [Tepidanaerobacteraceae bacterium]
MSDIKEELGFEVIHFGINCIDEENARRAAGFFSDVFGLSAKEGKDSIFSGSSIEIMKGAGRGRCGHIAISTKDIHRAREYLESLGLEFDPESKKYDSEGNLIVIYLKKEIAGFAVHLLQI